MEKKRSWFCTLATQFTLCAVLYLSLNLGQPQKKSVYISEQSQPLDFYFISVRGGFRPLQQQIHVLKQIENAVKVFRARFVINVSDLGEDDPLTQNASRLLALQNVPWYTTRASKDSKVGCFLKEINITHGKTLTIVGLDTGSIEDFTPSGLVEYQLSWLSQALEGNAANWIIVAGYHPVAVGEENSKQMQTLEVLEPLHRKFLKHGVNMYIGRRGCFNCAPQCSVAYIGVPDPTENETDSVSFHQETSNGFLLHRVSPLEITTYIVTSAGEVVHKTIMQQNGKAAM